jgi:2-methylcitrate dehydratase PrpD
MALELQEKHGIKSEDVEKIRIGLNHITAENQLKVAETPLHAQNHPAVAVAIALVEKKMFLREFFDCYDDPRVVELGQKTEVYTDPSIDEVFPTKIGTRVEIRTKDGTYEMFEEDKPPIPLSFIKEKFTAFATTPLPDDKVAKISELVELLDEVDELSVLTELFS